MRVRKGALLAAAVAGAMSLAAVDATASRPCPVGDDWCTLVTVPLDHSGVVPGTTRIYLGRYVARRPSRPPVLLIGGIPGQASTSTFGPRAVNRVASGLRAGGRSERDVYIMDLRGTETSGQPRCPRLERAVLLGDPSSAAAAACAASLGARRGLYTTHDSAEDIEAVRMALGEERLALVGASYGAQVALAYAQRHPNRVDRLVLDSAVVPGGSDPLYRSSFAAVPDVVRSQCRQHTCRDATRSPVADVVRLARRLEERPMRGAIVDGRGRRHAARLGPFDLFEALEESGPFGAFGFDRSLPGFVRNALRGDPVPLLRARSEVRDAWRQILSYPVFGSFFSAAAYAASKCEESQFPWSRDAPPDQRRRQAAAFVQALPAGEMSPFGPRTALASDVLELCRSWPTASAPPTPPSILPPIPTLLLVGRQALRTPPRDAEAVARLVPGAKILSFDGLGTDVITAVPRCPKAAVGIFLAGGTLPRRCDSASRPKRTPAGPPLSLAEVAAAPGTRGRPGRTLTAVQLTIGDGARRFRRFPFPGQGHVHRTGGLRRGSYRFSSLSGRLDVRGASYVPGVRISGSIARIFSRRSKATGVIHVAGPGAATGTLVVRNGMLSGELGGRNVAEPLRVRPR